MSRPNTKRFMSADKRPRDGYKWCSQRRIGLDQSHLRYNPTIAIQHISSLHSFTVSLHTAIMVATIAIAKSLTTLAGLLSLALSASASPTNMSKRQGLEIKSADFYHFKTVPPDPANGVSEQMANEQALSLAKFEGNHEAKYFWFLEKHPSFQYIGGPGTGCQVGLYFDSLWPRVKKAVELNWNYNATDKVEDKWAVAGGITPWCSENFMPKDNKDYKETDLGFISTRPSEEGGDWAFVMLK